MFIQHSTLRRYNVFIDLHAIEQLLVFQVPLKSRYLTLYTV